MTIALLALFTAVYSDIYLFKKEDRALFDQVFRAAPVLALSGSVLILAVLIFSGDVVADLPPVILLLVLPLYFLRREEYLRKSMAFGDEAMRAVSGALGVIIMWIYGVTVFALLLGGIEDIFPDAISVLGNLIVSAAFSSAWILCLIYRASCRFSDQGFLTNVGLRKGDKPWWKIFFVPAAAGLAFAFLSSFITVSRQVQPSTPLNEALEGTHSIGLILVFLALAILTAPLIEEIIFRGYFFHVVKRWLGTRRAVVIIALTFAFLHVGQYWGDWPAIAIVTFLGFALTMLRAWSSSTVASTVAHYVYNASVTFIPIVALALSNPDYFQYKAYYAYHDIQTKEALLEQAISRQPDLAEAYNELAWLYAEEGINLDRALPLIDTALDFAPEHPAFLDTKAAVLEQLGRHQEAQTIRRSLE